MAHTGVTTLLLLLALVISTVFGLGSTDPQCDILSANGNSTSAFNLTVSPDTLHDHADYTVRLEGNGNFTVILQALSLSGPVGNWTNGNISCNGSPLFLNAFEHGNQFHAQWTSTENVTSVNITAYIHDDSGTLIVSRKLSQAVSNQTTHLTTIAPGNSNNTVQSTTSTTATTPLKTTSAGSAVQTSLLTVIQILGLLITSKYLS